MLWGETYLFRVSKWFSCTFIPFQWRSNHCNGIILQSFCIWYQQMRWKKHKFLIVLNESLRSIEWSCLKTEKYGTIIILIINRSSRNCMISWAWYFIPIDSYPFPPSLWKKNFEARVLFCPKPNGRKHSIFINKKLPNRKLSSCEHLRLIVLSNWLCNRVSFLAILVLDLSFFRSTFRS